MKIAIIGAGISGLSLGSWLLKKSFPKKQISIFESSPKGGGYVGTIQEDGYLLEKAATFFSNKKLSIHRLCLFLGLDKDIILSSSRHVARYVYYKNHLNKIGKNHLEFFLLNLNSKEKFFILKNLLKLQSTTPARDESVKEFFVRNLGIDIFSNLVEPWIAGIYAGNPSELSMRACFPEYLAYEKKSGSLLRGAIQQQQNQPGLLSFRYGMHQLVEAMSEYLEDRIFFKKELKEIIFSTKKDNPKGKVVCVFQNNTRQAFDRVILSVPSYVASRILKKTAIAKKIKQIEYTPLVVCGLGFKKKEVAENLKGFGFLVPSYISKGFLGATFTSNIFPDYRSRNDKFLVQTYAGGFSNPDLVTWSDKEIVDFTKKSLFQFTNLNAHLEYSKVIRWTKAIPQYQMEHSAILKSMEVFTQQYPVHFHSNSYYGVSMADCIENLENLSSKLMESSK